MFCPSLLKPPKFPEINTEEMISVSSVVQPRQYIYVCSFRPVLILLLDLSNSSQTVTQKYRQIFPKPKKLSSLAALQHVKELTFYTTGSFFVLLHSSLNYHSKISLKLLNFSRRLLDWGDNVTARSAIFFDKSPNLPRTHCKLVLLKIVKN